MTEDLENKIHMRDSVELTSKEKAALKAAIASDPEAATYADFIDGTLAGAKTAPRDFVAEAIHAAHFRFKPVHLLIPAAIAAAIALSVILRTDPAADTPLQTERLTAQFSTRLDRIESEISTTRERISRSRYQRP